MCGVCVCVCLSHQVMSDSATPWTVACQTPPSMGFHRQEYWSALPFPFPGDLPDPEIETWPPAFQADSLLYILFIYIYIYIYISIIHYMCVCAAKHSSETLQEAGAAEAPSAQDVSQKPGKEQGSPWDGARGKAASSFLGWGQKDLKFKKKHIARLCLRRGGKTELQATGQWAQAEPWELQKRGGGVDLRLRKRMFSVGTMRGGALLRDSVCLYKVSTGNFWPMCRRGYF